MDTIDSLIAFYEANPSFFLDIFIPTYIAPLYLTSGLRATCRLLTRAIARPKRLQRLDRICRAAIESRNELLVRQICAMHTKEPNYGARMMVGEAIRCKELPFADTACMIADAKIGTARFSENCRENKIIKCAHLIGTARQMLTRVDIRAVERDPRPRIDDLYGLIGGLRLNKSEDVLDLFNIVLASISTDHGMINILKCAAANCGPRALDVWSAVLVECTRRGFEMNVDRWRTMLYATFENEGPCALAIYENIRAHLTMEELNAEIIFEDYWEVLACNGGPHARQLFLRSVEIPHEHVGGIYAQTGDYEKFCAWDSLERHDSALTYVAFNKGPDALKICAHILGSRDFHGRDALRQCLGSYISNDSVYCIELLDLVLASLDIRGEALGNKFYAYIARNNHKRPVDMILHTLKYAKEAISYDDILVAGMQNSACWREVCDFAIRMGATDVRGAFHKTVDKQCKTLFEPERIDYCEWLIGHGILPAEIFGIACAQNKRNNYYKEFRIIEIERFMCAHMRP